MGAQEGEHYVQLTPAEALERLTRLTAVGQDALALVKFLNDMTDDEFLLYTAAVVIVETRALPVLKQILGRIASERGIG